MSRSGNDIARTVLVTGGKGGVGKTTVAASLARRLSADHRVGLLDADVAGPSVPILLDLHQRPRVVDGAIVPVTAGNLKVMSTGLFAGVDKPFAWRGPLLRGALRQMVRDVAWGAIDILVVDTPPGTGEVHMILLDLIRSPTAVVVTTGQPMAVGDTNRCVTFLRQAEIPIAAVAENMAPEARCGTCGAARSPSVDLPDWGAPVVRLPLLGDDSAATTRRFDAAVGAVAAHVNNGARTGFAASPTR